MPKLTPTLPVLAIALFGAALFSTLGCGSAPADPYEGGPPQVIAETLEARPLRLVKELPGRTAPFAVAEIRPQVSGIIESRAFTEGSSVDAGSLLFQIDAEPYQAAVDRAAAELLAAKADVPALRSRARRLRELAKIHATGEQDADDAEAALLRAEASVAIAEAALKSAKIDLARTPITAPIAGHVGRATVTPGALVTAHQPTALATIHQLDPIYVDVTQTTAELLQLRRALESGALLGSEQAGEVRLLLEDGTLYPHPGKLAFRDVAVDPAMASVVVRVVFPNPKHLLLPGMFVRAVVEEGVREHAILAPQQGVFRDAAGNPVAWVVDADGTVVERSLVLGRAVGSEWLIDEGLGAGDRVIIKGRLTASPGAAVNVVPAAAEHAAEAPQADEPGPAPHGRS